MLIVNCEQNTPEWYEARLGIPTASGFDRIITTKGEVSKSREKYLYELAGEIVTGEQFVGYSNGNMDRGHEREQESREYYEFINMIKMDRPGFVYFDENKEFGCSPDGLVGKDGGFETKDAAPHIHIDRLENGWSQAQYYQQVQGSLYVTGRKWWDLQSYSRGFTPLVVRFERDEDFIRKLAVEIRRFNNDLKKLVEKYSIGGK